MPAFSGGPALDAFLITQEPASRISLGGDSLVNAPLQLNRYAHAFIKRCRLGGSINAFSEPRTTNAGIGGKCMIDHSNYEANDTASSANAANELSGGNTYGNWGEFAVPTADEYFGYPLEGKNWWFEGNLKAFASGSPPPSGALGALGRTLCRASDPIVSGVNTIGVVGTSPMVFRPLYYGAASLRGGSAPGTNSKFYNGITTLAATRDFTVDARPLWSEGDNPETAVSPRSGGPRLGELNALWPDVAVSNLVGGGTASYWTDTEAEGASGAIAATPGGSLNVCGTMGFRCKSSSDPDYLGGPQVDIWGASSWGLAGLAQNIASSVSSQKAIDDDNWKIARDVTTVDRSLKGVIIPWLDPEALAQSVVAGYVESMVDKFTNADLAIGTPTPIIIIPINPKTDARTVAEMIAWRDGIIAGCANRINAGWVNLFDLYGQAKPAGFTDGTHPDDETAANAVIDAFWNQLQIAWSSGTRIIDLAARGRHRRRRWYH